MVLKLVESVWKSIKQQHFLSEVVVSPKETQLFRTFSTSF